jgi:hypothetical protein
MELSNDQQLQRSKIKYATRKALQATCAPDIEANHGDRCHAHQCENLKHIAADGYYNGSEGHAGRKNGVQARDDQRIPQSYLDEYNKLWNYDNETYGTGPYKTEEERETVGRKDQYLVSNKVQRDVYNMSGVLNGSNQCQQIYNARSEQYSYDLITWENQDEVSAMPRPPLRSKFSWSDSGSENVEESPQTSKRHLFFREKKRDSTDSGYSTTRSSYPRKSFRDCVRRRFGRR